MAAAGIKGKRGRPIQYPSIYEMLKNEKYTGVYVYNTKMPGTRSERRAKTEAIRIENALPAIITKEQFEEVRKIMNARKQTGNKAGYLCSGLVYCSCGAKMHGFKSKRRGNEYLYFSCSAKCGTPCVRMEDVDAAAMTYLNELLSSENQELINAALQQYQIFVYEETRRAKISLKMQINEKERQYEKLIRRYADDLTPDEMADVGKCLRLVKEELSVLRENPLPKADYTENQVISWLQSLKSSKDAKALQLLIERIDVIEKTEFNITSTLNSVLGENGRGDSCHCLPAILFWYMHNTIKK